MQLLKYSFFMMGLLFILPYSWSQSTTHLDEDEHLNQEIHEHHHGKHEIGLANSLVYFVKEKEVAYGLHFHYMQQIGHSKFGWGLAYERVFDEHKHNTFGVVGSFRPIEPLSFSLSPGLSFEDAHPDEWHFSFHAETTYEFAINDFHIGPLLEFAVDPEDYHISFGVHFAYSF